MSIGVSGSSPHTRGAQRRRQGLAVGVRIIPAYAGSTSGVCYGCVDVGDHPRIRGEHAVVRLERQLPIGSSPHTRGAPPAGAGAFGISRIIPAYAGSTPPGSRASSSRQDHPRIRGEHSYLDCSIYFTNGSSPHTRGAHPVVLRHGDRLGIIPAYAGSTSTAALIRSQMPDHPRIRGEHERKEQADEHHHGSSPHTRGAHDRRSPPNPHQRIIPAYAGSTVKEQCQTWAGPDHPRIRGEHLAVARSAAASPGSSPHTRGAHWVGHPDGGGAGIIPAYAGST